MLVLAYCTYILFLFYGLIQLYFAIQWLIKPSDDLISDTYSGISIIIPFKNEADHLDECIQSVIRQKYPLELYELILVDDHSDDISAEICKKWQQQSDTEIKLIISQKTGKKEAIAMGVEHCNFDHIITLDADCSVNKNWLSHFLPYFKLYPDSVIVGPVLLNPEKENAFHYFQALEFLGLNVITLVAGRNKIFFNGSGANLGFSKSLYLKYRETAKDSALTSGDDIFLIFSAIEQQKPVIYPKNRQIIVSSKTLPSWQQFINQRVRWSTKSVSYSSNLLFLTWLIPVFTSFLLTYLLLFSLITLSLFSVQIFLFALVIKLTADFCLLKTGYDFYRIPPFRYFLKAELMHIVYLIHLSFRFLFHRSFQWKGRTSDR